MLRTLPQSVSFSASFFFVAMSQMATKPSRSQPMTFLTPVSGLANTLSALTLRFRSYGSPLARDLTFTVNTMLSVSTLMTHTEPSTAPVAT